MNPIRLISVASAGLVTLLAALSFLISYHALADLAAATGATPEELKWAFPLVLDGAIIVFSCAALRSALLKESSRTPFALVIFATLMSIALNILHTEGSSLGKLMAATPPLLLALSIETIIRQIRTGIERAQTLESSQELEKRKSELESKLFLLESNSVQGVEKLSPKQKELKSRRLSVLTMYQDGIGEEEIATKLEISKWTVKRDLQIIEREQPFHSDNNFAETA